MMTMMPDDDGAYDYVGNGSIEEEYGAYKTSSFGNSSQSEQFKLQQKQELETNALISSLGLFLVKTWNWLRYFFVTIIFLNLVHFVDGLSSSGGGGESVINRGTKSVEVVDDTTTTVVEESEEKEEKEKEESESRSIIAEDNENRSTDCMKLSEYYKLEEESETNFITMSPNTCSIQNQQQEVEKAEEAIVVAVVAEKLESVIAPTEADLVQEKLEEKEQVAIITVLTEDDESDENDDVDSGIRRDSVDSCTSSEGSGNLGDAEDGSCGKSVEDDGSNDNDSNSDDIASSENNEENAKETAQKIISQVESMFSDEHLAKDGFLLKHVRRRSDGFVSLKLVAGLRKVKQISREFPTVLNALKDSSKLEINSEGTKVRRVEPLTSFLKAVPIKSKDKEQTNSKQTKDKDSSNDETHQNPVASNKIGSKTGLKEGNNNQNRRHSTQNNTNGGNQSRRNSNAHNNRKSSTTSTGSSNNSSRHNSFSKAPGHGSSSVHPADLFRNVYTSTMAAYSSSGEECQSPQVVRRRGGSLPITALQRSSGAHLSPNSSPPNNGAFVMIGPNGGARPKSNSYCEGTVPSTMSPWLQRRKASASSRLSSGELSFSGVVRQPRGPDGTKGFANGYRAMILQERLQQQSNSALSA